MNSLTTLPKEQRSRPFDERDMKQIDTLFDRVDAWRHLPNYQLERRADLFFSLYLSKVLEATLGFPVADQIVPEFPVRIVTIYPDKRRFKPSRLDPDESAVA